MSDAPPDWRIRPWRRMICWFQIVFLWQHVSNTGAWMTAVPKKSTGVFYIPVTKLHLVCLWKSVAAMKTLLIVFLPPMSSKDKRAMGYLGDACCMTCWQGVVGELISCWGRGMAGALLQLVPQLGHLRAEWIEKWFRSHYDSFWKGRGYSLSPQGPLMFHAISGGGMQSKGCE